jgi:hypothetical protein
MKRLTLWFADLWPVHCIACIYQRFLVLGFVLGVAVANLLIYMFALYHL